MSVKFGFTQGLNVARLGLDESQVITACQIADRMDYDSVWIMDHSNVPQWKNAVVNDAWLMLARYWSGYISCRTWSLCNRCDKAPSFKYCPFDNHPR